ncbi:MAG: tryptophan 2,3-dioxygenase [Pseudomonadota bacterium]
MSADMSYGDYLRMDDLLHAQRPITQSHDEMLFIIQHQTTELWMKQVIHELLAVREAIKQDQLSPAFKMMARVARIFAILDHAWSALSTLTPSEYLQFRDQLGRSSGFQSHQYRAIEFLAGNKNKVMLRPHAHVDEVHVFLSDLLRAPSLYDEAQRLLSRRGLAIESEHLNRDLTQPYSGHPSVEEAWGTVYRDVDRHWDLYELAEKLVDFEHVFRNWRFAHVTTVERIIGHKKGTGGTAGVSYLTRMLDVKLFPELWSMRTELRSK